MDERLEKQQLEQIKAKLRALCFKDPEHTHDESCLADKYCDNVEVVVYADDVLQAIGEPLPYVWLSRANSKQVIS